MELPSLRPFSTRNFQTDFLPSKGTCCTLKESNLVGLSIWTTWHTGIWDICPPLYRDFCNENETGKKKQPPHATSVKPSGIPAETFWFTTIEGLSVLTKATPSIDTFADMFPLLLQVEVYCKSTSTLLFFGERMFFLFCGVVCKKTSRNSFQHSTAKQIIGSFWSLLFFRGWKRCKWWMGQLLENPINYIPEALSKTHMKPTNIKCFGIWCLVFLLNLGDFQVPLAQINCLARSPFVKPFPVALG